jgi:hypothetical protein
VGHLFAQGALAQGRNAAMQVLEGGLVVDAGILAAKAVEVAEHALVDEADQAVELQQRVLQGRGRQQYLGARGGQAALQHIGDDVAGFVDVAQPVGLVIHHDVPGQPAQIVDLGLGELIGADDRLAAIEGVGVALLSLLVVVLGLQDDRFERELVRQLLMPLLAQVGEDNDQDAALSLGPELGQHQPGLDGLAQPDLVGQDHAPRQGVAGGEERRVDLVVNVTNMDVSLLGWTPDSRDGKGRIARTM